MKGNRAALFWLLLVLVFSSVAFANVKDLCPDRNGAPDNLCILKQAMTVADCQQMGNGSVFLDECYQNIAKYVSDCNTLPVAARSECFVYQTWKVSPDNMSACGSITPDYRENCYIYYIQQNNPGDLDACDTIPSGFVGDCQKKVMNGLMPSNQTCAAMKPKYQALCMQTVKEQEQFAGLAVGIVGATLGAMGLIFLSPFICAGAVFLVLVIALVYVLTRKQNGNGKQPPV